MDRIVVAVRVYRDRAALQLQWVDPVTGRRKTRSAETADPGIAEQKRGDLEYQLNHGLGQRSARLSWPAFVETFTAEHLPTCRPASRRAFGHALSAFERLARPGGLASLDTRVVSRFHAALLSEDYAPSTISLWLGLLKTALRWAQRQGLLAAVPNFPAVKVPVKPPRPLPAELYERVLPLAGPLAPLLELGWHAGLRVGEAVALVWDEQDECPWVDLQANRIRFPAGASKGGREEWVPISPALRDVLEGLQTSQKVEEHPQTSRVVPLACVDHNRAWYARLLVRRLAKRAGVRFTFHALRKAFCSRYAARVPAQVLQRLARHHSISVTMQYYAEIDRDVEAAVMGGLDPSHVEQR